jgi:hypothetical protein
MAKTETGRRIIRRRVLHAAGGVAVVAAVLAIGPMTGAPLVGAAAIAEPSARKLPPPPANGEMGFVIERFTQPVIFEKEACPTGPALKLEEAYLATLPKAERTRLLKPENTAEREAKWKAFGFGPNGTNVCTHPDMFPDRPLNKTVQSPRAWGLDLDGGDTSDTCDHKEFVTPTGQRGIDNQEYRAMGCTLEWRGVDGIANDQEVGMKQFHASGEWTQVLLLRGVDSLENDDDVEVIYANTPDRPVIDAKGKWLRGISFNVSDKFPRYRNVLKGRIRNGVLTTDPNDIKLTYTWGQGGQRDLRGIRSKFDFRKGRLRLEFQPDGSLTGMLGGYRPLFDNVISPALGGAGSVIVAKIDCAAALKTLQANADGLKNPKTGKCEGVSAAYRISAVPAFVTDVPSAQRIANR